MKITKQLILPLVLLFMLAYARGQDIHYNYDRGANFQSYRTYQWVDVQRGPGGPSEADVPTGLPNLPVGPPPMSASNVQDDQLLDQDIRRAVDAQLAEKGLTKVDKGGNLFVGYQANVHEEKSINLSGSGGYGWSGGGPWGGLSSFQGQTSTVPIGTLVVGLYDPARKQLIWRGDASKTVNLKKDPNKNYANLQKAMVKLFKNYPPQPGK
ncbi:DUF4136 domain-containing protein [Edaphobacter modestus]|uniref:Uncharacterized protein DUF4136 n=1 Tax=Edaphobacter modestus TaxID=388466 RepID=A0A4Q7YEF4_9BACT|nr:DUF4136 domain-containing protein [Edaphobacter modestus]RZU35520.1 uncharacterized protein DUF4136 [Edaphobacter modestus]